MGYVGSKGKKSFKMWGETGGAGGAGWDEGGKRRAQNAEPSNQSPDSSFASQ